MNRKWKKTPLFELCSKRSGYSWASTPYRYSYVSETAAISDNTYKQRKTTHRTSFIRRSSISEEVHSLLFLSWGWEKKNKKILEESSQVTLFPQLRLTTFIHTIHIPSWTTKKIWEKRFISPMGMIPLLVSPPLPNDKPDERINGIPRAKRKEFLVRYEFLMSEEVSSSRAKSLCYCSEARLFTDW